MPANHTSRSTTLNVGDFLFGMFVAAALFVLGGSCVLNSLGSANIRLAGYRAEHLNCVELERALGSLSDATDIEGVTLRRAVSRQLDKLDCTNYGRPYGRPWETR